MAGLHSNRGAKRAREAWAALGHTREGPLPDLLEAVEAQGGANVVVLELPEGVAGAYVARPGLPLLFVNGGQALSRQRFTLAHEFGHHRMGRATVIDAQAAIGPGARDPHEIAANAFAAWRPSGSGRGSRPRSPCPSIPAGSCRSARSRRPERASAGRTRAQTSSSSVRTSIAPSMLRATGQKRAWKPCTRSASSRRSSGTASR